MYQRSSKTLYSIFLVALAFFTTVVLYVLPYAFIYGSRIA